MGMTLENKPRYVCVRAAYGLFNVVDALTGSPAELDVTTILLTRKEASRLIHWIESRNRSFRADDRAASSAVLQQGSEETEEGNDKFIRFADGIQ
ncbi:hypothetical protein FHT76_008067 [Rhizobium sp. BK176]|uniref:hypothetical protein n=1 Tax=Rhizobium sp. BK661 TaxID=2586991 RepID=UPI0017FA0D06|nr:hypothetical protein [Rhizobium sp. BK661]MBB3545248.1 hypothetical protein [Rhizobium sp. BK399]MCS3743226.1 hypothetical protein [Rhizobium sp. BK661]MCS4096346.1 hypothetical protein [Rhizobium sp. BK176]